MNKLAALDISYTQNRELSWLRFNERVLEEAMDDATPLYERLKFAAIFSSNLDEFFMIRVGGLSQAALAGDARPDDKSLLTPAEQLERIFQAASALYRKKDCVWAELEDRLRDYNIENLDIGDLKETERKLVGAYFKNDVTPLLSPQVIEAGQPFPHIDSHALYIAAALRRGADAAFGLIRTPDLLPRAIFMPGGGVRYVLLEKIIFAYARAVFAPYEIVSKTILRLTRNGDISMDDKASGAGPDYRRHIIQVLKKRPRLAPVRLEIQGDIAPPFLAYLCGRLGIGERRVFRSRSPLCMAYAPLLEGKLSPAMRRVLLYEPFEPQLAAQVRLDESVLEQALARDFLLSYPYQRFEAFLRLLRDAAYDERVVAIKISIYRLSGCKSRLLRYLAAAAGRGKEVTVLMELRARFDEYNNILCAQSLEEAGCKVIYGFRGFKVHAKICLIVLCEQNRLRYITQIGTGNYNETTARLYTDLSLITANPAFGRDAAAFFENMAAANPAGRYDTLWVGPVNLKERLRAKIEREIKKARAGRPARIVCKVNALADREVVDWLAAASQAGVPVDLLVRGICCLLPGIAGKTERVRVVSVVGRFLEHARIFCFGEGDAREIFLSSADLMTRNMENRIELAAPVLDGDLKKEIWSMLEAMRSDTRKARRLTSDGSYGLIPSPPGRAAFDSQRFLMRRAQAAAAAPPARR